MAKNPNEIRIIGGKWRGRKLKFVPQAHLRPTPNRVRETLFNWLAPIIDGAICLDLFAGSGALGFEALSRGAGYVVMVDKSAQVIKTLKENAAIFQAEHIEFINAKFSPKMKNIFSQKFDIVFLDPPFYKNLIKPSLEWLQKNDCLAANALVYVEKERQVDLPENWKIYRGKIAGQVSYSVVYYLHGITDY
jgi:16S rRNA (guanine966-N2)-methyltransferase